MTSRLVTAMAGLALLLAMATAALAQDTTTKTTTTTTTQTTAVQNPDGSWTVVEYPVDKQVTVTLSPVTTVDTTTTAVMPRATVLRSANGTLITVDPAGFAGTTGAMNLYAVDPMGHITLLGPINATSTSPLTFNTNLNRFMLVVSPEGNLTTYAPSTTFAYRSAVPEGLSVIPLARTGEGLKGEAEGEKVAATIAPSYTAPMLNVSTLPAKKETQVKVKFSDTAHIKRADFFVTPNFNNKGLTRVKAKFHDLTDVPTDAFLTLWAVSPDGKFFRIGSTPNKGNPNVATIDSDKNNTNVPFTDFGLFMTVEPTAMATAPTTTIFGTIVR
ncbi:MAG: hypothetical protein ICV60_03545 [Pyrinomonadaceae bacterium]|nr:hypothetical protein [Pyrinomonadaceae bacterium]